MSGSRCSGSVPDDIELAYPLEILAHDSRLKLCNLIPFRGEAVPSLGGIPLLAELGQGGMGAVYYGIHPRLCVGVAVKILPPNYTGNRLELASRFRREAQVAARVKSPHLVSMIDVNRENGIDYLVMEHVLGVTAHALLRERNRRGLFENDALRICLAATKGLAAAHAAGVIHRDVKPSNILIPRVASEKRPRFEEARLADLGIARVEGSSEGLTQTATTLGTFGYMAPEQAQDARHADMRADVFSMGATLYALLSGHTPFGKTSLVDMFRATLKCEYRPLEEVRHDLSEATLRLTALCLSKSRSVRPKNGAALAKELEACLDAANRDDTRRGNKQKATSRVISRPQQSPPKDPPTRASEQGAKPMRVVLIDDDAVARVMLKRMLARLPWQTEVHMAESVSEAQEHLKIETPDIILTDVCMDEADGYEMIEWVRGRDHLSVTPIVAVSSIPETVGKRRCLMVGADGYLQKPVRREKLERVMRRMKARLGSAA